MRHENGLRRDYAALYAEAPLRRGDQRFHHERDMVNVQARAMIGAVARLGAEQLDQAAHPALAYRILALDDQRAAAHTKDRPVTAAVERQRRFLDAIIGGSSADS